MPADDLSELMAAAARELQDQADATRTMQAAVDVAVRDIGGAEGASLCIIRKGKKVETLAATDDGARRGDELQYEAGEGPCLDAVWREPLVYSADFTREERWPAWASRAAEETGYRSLMAFQLFVTGNVLGALNLYSRRAGGFDVTDRDYGVALAAHIAVAVRSSRDADGLREALDTRTAIATAVGFVMGRFNVDNAKAFAVLSRLASTQQRTVHDIAVAVLADGELPTGQGE